MKLSVSGPRASLLALALAAIAAPIDSVRSQEAATNVGLEEIIVTARKREETLIDVPVAVTALSAVDVEQRGVENLQDVALFTPGLTYFDAIQNQLGTPVIRGISQTNLNSPDRNVAIFYGGVYLANTSAANLEILDVDRIEVVKGPQSALYGRNAFNGAINYVPAAPTSEFFARVEGTVGSDERYEGKLTVSGPLSDTVRARLSTSYNTFDGTYTNAADTGDNLGGFETKNVSATIEFVPNDALDISLFGFYTDDQREPGPLYFAAANNCGGGGMLTAFCGEIPFRDTLASNPLAEGFDREVTLGALDVSYDLGPVTLVSQTSQYEATAEIFSEYSANGTGDTYDVILRANATSLAAYRAAPAIRRQAVPQFTGGPPTETSAFSQEFRVESDAEKRLRGAVGFFYFKNEFEAVTGSSFDARGLAPTETIRDAIGFTFFSPGTVSTNPREIVVSNFFERTDYQRAWFGTAEFDILENVTIGAELRRDTEDRQQVNTIIGPASLQRREFDYTTWRYSADWQITDRQTVYASAAKGVVSGYFNPTFDAVAGQPVPVGLREYEPAVNKTYEIGWKSEWLDRRLSTEVALFYIDYTDLQITTTPPAPLVANLIQNIGGAEAKGVELTANFAVTENWRTGVTYSHSPTEFDEPTPDRGMVTYCGSLTSGFCPTTVFRGVVSPDVGGQSLSRAPETTASGYVAFDTPLASDWSLYARADVSYISKAYTQSLNFAEYGERTLTNARIGFRRGENLDIAVWGRNIFDEEYVSSVIFQPRFSTFQFLPNVSQGEGATYGVTVSYRFDEGR